jgi:hypothetical protein
MAVNFVESAREGVWRRNPTASPIAKKPRSEVVEGGRQIRADVSNRLNSTDDIKIEVRWKKVSRPCMELLQSLGGRKGARLSNKVSKRLRGPRSLGLYL